MEFRIRSHDGERLWGLFARPTWQSEPWRAAVRSVGPADRPCINTECVRAGVAEFVFQEPAGRRLADRVIDVMQVCRLALETEGIEEVNVLGPTTETLDTDRNDELMIADQLITHRIMPPRR